MAKQKRKPAKSKPITGHQLFPAVVALWFGALFGLGSLAVRPTLIENLVLSSRLDLVIPAAAPPLGVTSRMLIALIMAATGAILGVVLARRLARPKDAKVERKRGAQDLSARAAGARGRFAQTDAPARKPISVKDDLGDEIADSAAAPIAGRRRALAIEHAEDEFVPHDMAPLPGGTTPIYQAEAHHAEAEPLPSPTESGAFSPMPAGGPSEAPKLDWNAPAPIVAQDHAEASRQLFQPLEQAPAAQPIDPIVAPALAAVHADGRQVFGMAQPTPPPEQPRQIFGAAIEGDHVSQDFVKEAGFRTSVFETEEHSPLFERSESAQQPAEPAVEPQTLAPLGEAPAVAIPAVCEPEEASVPQSGPLAAEPAPAASAAAFDPAPASQVQAESPASLGMTDLAARLAESMRRRRAARAGAGDGQAVPVAPEAPVAAAPAFDTAIPAVDEQEAVPPEPVGATFEPAPLPQFAPLTEAIVPQIPVEPEPVPAAVAPEPTPSPAVPPAIPSAMRPLALDAFLAEDAAVDPSLLPPRHIAMPAPPAFADPVPATAPAQPAGQAAIPVAFDPAPLDLAAEDEVADEASAEDNYASLLGIGQSKAGFVRIEEPECDLSAPEPVVIFPGQAPLVQSAQPAAFAPTPAEGSAAPFRRFDDPAAADHGQPVAAHSAAPAIDSGAADQALRAALASLQRMSGAA